MYQSTKRDLRRRSLERLRVVRNFLYLCWAPFGMRPSDFRSQPGTNKPYRNLGWTVPGYPALIYAFATEPMRKGLSEEMKAKPGDDAFADIMKEYADTFVETIWVSNFFLLIYMLAFGSWAFHGTLCWVFRLVNQQARNAPFEYYLVWWSGVMTLFALTTATLFIPYLAEHGEGWRHHVSAWIVQYPLLMLGLFLVFAVPWWIANYHPNRGMSEVYTTPRQHKTSIWVMFALAVAAFIGMVIRVRMMAASLEGG